MIVASFAQASRHICIPWFVKSMLVLQPTSTVIGQTMVNFPTSNRPIEITSQQTLQLWQACQPSWLHIKWFINYKDDLYIYINTHVAELARIKQHTSRRWPWWKTMLFIKWFLLNDNNKAEKISLLKQNITEQGINLMMAYLVNFWGWPFPCYS